MITITAWPAKQRFGRNRKRGQWKFEVTGGNGEPIDPRDTYANLGAIQDIWRAIVASGEPVRFRVRYPDGETVVSWLRGGPDV